MRLLTNLESATLGGYSMSRCTWSSSPLLSTRRASKSWQMRVKISRNVSWAFALNTFLRYLVTKTKWTCNAKTQCLPVRKSFVFAIDQLYNMSMQIRKGYKYRLKTNRGVEAKFVRFAGACRFIWNKILSINEHRYFAGVPRLPTPKLVSCWRGGNRARNTAGCLRSIVRCCNNA